MGSEGVDKRIDVLAAAIKQKLTVYDLEELELGYCPLNGNFKNSINLIGNIASNYLHGLVDFTTWDQIDHHLQNKSLILDLRTKQEFAWAHIPGSVNIPVDTIREKMSTLPKDRHILLVCAVGHRAYFGYRILSQNGFKNISVLGGGFVTWHFAKAVPQSNENIFTEGFKKNFYNKPVPSRLLNTQFACCDTAYVNFCKKLK